MYVSKVDPRGVLLVDLDIPQHLKVALVHGPAPNSSQ